MKIVPLFIMLFLGLEGFSQAPPPTANNVSITTCDDDGTNDGQKTYNLTSLNPQILGPTQSPANFDVNFYSDSALTKPILNPASSTLYHTYAQVVDKNNPSSTSAAADVYVTVIAKPILNLDVPTICVDSKTGKITDAYIVSGYSGSYKDVSGNPQPLYSFQWKDSTGVTVSQNNNFLTDTAGNYTLEVMANTPENCTSGVYPFTVYESALPAKVTYTTSGYFSESQTITVNAEPYIGDGSNFLYSLDGKKPQSSNVFTDVKPGPHEIRVIDSDGCGFTSTPVDVQIVYNPKYFTPNGDGFNDRFTIKALEGQKDMLIYIFDRDGKLITQLLSESEGWDGTFNGQPLPASDYWFTVSYTEEGIKKEYKSHFSLLR